MKQDLDRERGKVLALEEQIALEEREKSLW